MTSPLPTSATATQAGTVLLVVPDPTRSAELQAVLNRRGHATLLADGPDAAHETLARVRPDAAIVDVSTPGGLGLLPQVAARCPVLVLTTCASIDEAVQAVQMGAAEYLVAPVAAETLDPALSRVLETARLRRDVSLWQSHAQRAAQFELIGASPVMDRLRERVALVASADAPVLILGEGGSGKGVAAAAIHAASTRANGRFVTVDCDPDLAPADLLGSRGPGSGTRHRDGLLSAAEHGTLYLNDVEKLSPQVQGRLFRVLEDGNARAGTAFGADLPRVIASTAADLQALAAEGRFHPELYYRLTAFVIEVPALRDRPDDIPAVAGQMLASRPFQRGVDKRLTPAAQAALLAHRWPGNLRELANALDRAVILSAGEADMTPAHLGLATAPRLEQSDEGVVLRFAQAPTLEALRAAYVALILERNRGNRQQTARDLGISERNLYRLLKADAGED